jgi:hypothetical protein
VASAFTFVLAEDDGEKKFVIHGEVRQRLDYLDNWFDFDDDESDSGLMFPYRARIAAEGHFTKDVVGYTEFQMFGVWGDTVPNHAGDPTTIVNGMSFLGPSYILHPVDQNSGNSLGNSVDLYQAWVGINKIGGKDLSLKIGRQEIVKGSEMLLGDLDYYSGISHDGIVGCWAKDSFDLDVWWTRPLQNNQFFIVNPLGAPDHQSINFYGAWVDFTKIPHDIGVAAYLLYFENGTQITTPLRRAFYTIGARANQDAKKGENGFAWNGEIAMQSGDFNPGTTGELSQKGDISAMAFEGMFGYNLHTGGGDHMFQAKYVMATGQKDPADPDFDGEKAEAFDPLFQDYHMRYGLSDIFVLSDLTAMSVGWNMQRENSVFGVDYWMYDLAEDAFQAGGTTSDLGSEVDAWYKFQYNPNTQFMAGLAYFMPGDVVEFSTLAGAPTDAGLRIVGNARLRF